MKLSLHQEYLQRHCANVPVVLYNKATHVFLKNKDRYEWRFVSILWRHQESHPGFFEATYSQPLHNGFESQKFLKDFFKSQTWYWDEYEKNILNLVSSIKSDGFKAIEAKNQMLAAWEMFLLIADSWLAKTTDTTFFKYVEQSINSNCSISKRLESCKKAQDYLRENNNSAYDFWFFQMRLSARDQNNYWLTRLINE